MVIFSRTLFVFMRIGPYQLDNNLILAPMSGITDRPFRDLCRSKGAGLTVSEMISSKPGILNQPSTRLKTDRLGHSALTSVQILGTEPQQMADAAKFGVDRGADIIDINMGCPAKKVCSVAAGSALLKDEIRVARILTRVTSAIDVPVTLKIRTGWDNRNRNAVTIARIAEDSGIQALTIHGRTRACRFNGQAEYETIRQVKQHVRIPVIANGDIDSAAKARQVLQLTGADGLMIGRAARGYPWIFSEVESHLNGNSYQTPSIKDIQSTVNIHLENLYSFYGNLSGVRIARKHIGWYLDKLSCLSKVSRQKIYQACQPSEQLALINLSFNNFTC